MRLSLHHERFVAEYLKDLNASAAYRRAGYSAKGGSADVGASRLLKSPQIQAAIAVRHRQALAAADLTVDRVVREVARLAFSDVRKMFDANGEVRPIHTLDDDCAAAVASLETHTMTEAGKPSQDGADADPEVQRMVRKLRVWDKVSALSLAMRFHGLLRDNVALTGTVNTAVTYRARMPKRGEEEPS